jgi:hypothetical protein
MEKPKIFVKRYFHNDGPHAGFVKRVSYTNEQGFLLYDITKETGAELHCNKLLRKLGYEVIIKEGDIR